MTARSAGVAKRPASARAARSRGSSTVPEIELDESKFSSLTADMCLPHFVGLPPAPTTSTAAPNGKAGGVVAGFFVNKTEAAPSVVSRPSLTAPSSFNDVAVRGQVDDQLRSLRAELTAL